MEDDLSSEALVKDGSLTSEENIPRLVRNGRNEYGIKYVLNPRIITDVWCK